MDVDLGQLREPCACGMEHNIDVEKIVIESGAVKQLEEDSGRVSESGIYM